MCIIYWQSLITGFIGHGEALECSIAEAWLKSLESYPDIIHWVETVSL